MLTIELSTVVFYRGEIEHEIALRDSSFPMAKAPRKALSALYGTQGKQDGFVAARSYAVSQGLNYTVVDLLVDLEEQNPQVMKPDNLSKFDFLNVTRMSRALGDDIASRLAEVLTSADLDGEPVEALFSQPLRAVLARWPHLADPLMDLDGCKHLKVIAFPAVTLVGARPVAIGCVQHRHWSAIREATCRLNPNIRVNLDAPS